MVYSLDHDCLRFLWTGDHLRRVLHLGSVAFLAYLHFNQFIAIHIQGTFVAYGKNVKLELLCLSPRKRHRKFLVRKRSPTIPIPINTVRFRCLLCKVFLPNHHHKLDLPFLVFSSVCLLQINQTIQSKPKQDHKVFQRHTSETNELLWPDLAIPVYHNDVGEFHSVQQIWRTYCRDETELGAMHFFICDFIDLAGVCHGIHLRSAFGNQCGAFLVLVQWHLLPKDFFNCEQDQ